MSDHDPLCVKTSDRYSMKVCECDLITRVREDERRRSTRPVDGYDPRAAENRP